MVVAQNEAQVIGGQSSYLKYLPAQYSESEFTGRFLMIFESVLGPLETLVDNLAFYFDPSTSPEELLPWLASWTKLELDPSWSLERRRELVKAAPWLFKWRGTRRGLREYLKIYTGIEPEIVEDFGGITLGALSELGRNTVLGGGNPYAFTVTFRADDPNSINLDNVKKIIESEKPAHSSYLLRVTGKAPEASQ